MFCNYEINTITCISLSQIQQLQLQELSLVMGFNISYQLIQPVDEFIKIIFNYGPNNFIINPEIIMDNAIPEPTYSFPLNLRMESMKGICHIGGIALSIPGIMVWPVSFGLPAYAPQFVSSEDVSLIMLLKAVLSPVLVWMVPGEIMTIYEIT